MREQSLHIHAMAGITPEAEVAATVRALTTGLEDFKARFNGRMDAIEEELNKNALHAAARTLNGSGEDTPGDDPDYRKTFASYTRRGASDAEATLKSANATGDRASIMAAMSEGDNSAGGYVAPVEWDRKIQKFQRVLSPMRQLSFVVSTNRAAYSTLWSNDQWGSGWVGEVASRPATATATLAPLVIASGEIYANPAATQRLLDDAAINFEEWISTVLSDEFSRQEGIAFVAGDGVNKPMGFLRYVPGDVGASAHPGGTLGITLSGSAAAVDKPDALIDLKYGLGAPYRQNSTWLMNSQTAAVIAKLKDGQGNYLWREAMLASEPSTLLGRPVAIDENMPNIAAGMTPIAFGDFARGYVVNDRVGIRMLRDPYTNKPYVSFYTTKRVGGGVLDPQAIRLLKVAAS